MSEDEWRKLKKLKCMKNESRNDSTEAGMGRKKLSEMFGKKNFHKTYLAV